MVKVPAVDAGRPKCGSLALMQKLSPAASICTSSTRGYTVDPWRRVTGQPIDELQVQQESLSQKRGQSAIEGDRHPLGTSGLHILMYTWA